MLLNICTMFSIAITLEFDVLYNTIVLFILSYLFNPPYYLLVIRWWLYVDDYTRILVIFIADLYTVDNKKNKKKLAKLRITLFDRKIIIRLHR